MALTLSLLAEASTVEQAKAVMEEFRALAVRVGCPASSVSPAMRWPGEVGRPIKVSVTCTTAEEPATWEPAP